MWDELIDGFCWKCEELTINENKKKYENNFRDNSLQRTTGDKETSAVPNTKQEG
jgi:hypothetical protein